MYFVQAMRRPLGVEYAVLPPHSGTAPLGIIRAEQLCMEVQDETSNINLCDRYRAILLSPSSLKRHIHIATTN